MAYSALILVLLFAVPLAAQDDLADALKALDNNQPVVAEQLLRRAVAADPGNYYAHFNLALVLGMEDKDAEAITEYRKTLELKPGVFEADLNLGILLVRGKQADAAVPVLKEAAELKPTEFRPQLIYAQALYATGDFPLAQHAYESALAIDPKSADAELGVARSLLKQAKLMEAAPHYRSAIALDAGYRKSLLELGAALDKAGQSAEAIAIFREFPDEPVVAARLGQMLVDNNKAVDALPQLEAAVRRSPTPANRMSLAEAYRQLNQMPKAIEQIQMASAANPKSVELHMTYGRVLRDARQFAAASREFRAAADLQPDSAVAWNELAGAAVLAENYPEGLEALDKVRALGKEIPGDLYLRAITLDKVRQKPQALEAYEQFLKAAAGKYPDQEFIATQRARIIKRELGK